MIFLFVYFSLDNYNINMLMSEILVFRDFHISRLFLDLNASALTDLTIRTHRRLQTLQFKGRV